MKLECGRWRTGHRGSLRTDQAALSRWPERKGTGRGPTDAGTREMWGKAVTSVRSGGVEGW